jgi:hypothetical protein
MVLAASIKVASAEIVANVRRIITANGRNMALD